MGDFEAAFQKLARSPGIGHSRGDLVDEEFSLFRVHSWMVIYRPRAKPMRIIRVLHSARDIHELLG